MANDNGFSYISVARKLFLALVTSMLISSALPQAAAKSDSSKVNPQVANVVAAALVLKPQPVQKNMTANYDLMVQQIKQQQDAQEAAQALLDAQAAQQTTPAPTTSQTASNTPETQPDSYYKLYIYNHESGNDPGRWNSSGCVGLGQACPASKLQAVCPNLDYACEDNWFSNYALQRYGGWAQAYQYWLGHSNW